MNYGNLKSISLLVIPLLLALSFLAAKTTLVQADAFSNSIRDVDSDARMTGPTVLASGRAFDATSAATGSLTISGVTVSRIGATSAAVTWDTDDPSNSLVRYGLASGALGLSATSPITATQHAVGLTNLSPATQYFFEVESIDDDGDTAVDNNGGSLYSFTTAEAALQRKSFAGTVVGNPRASVVLIQQGTGAERTISLPGDYSLRTPGGDRAGAFVDGADVVILAEKAGDEWVAIWVLVKPTRVLPPLTGVVTSIGSTSITITDPDGIEHMLRIAGQAQRAAEDVEVGEVVTALRGSDSQANGLVTARKTRDRLLKNIEEDEAEDKGKESSEIEFKGKRAEALIRALEHLGIRQLDMLGRALDRVPAAVKIKLRDARVRVEIEIDSDREASNKARVRFNIDDESGGEGSSNQGSSENIGRGNGQNASDEPESDKSSGSSDEPNRNNGRGQGNSGKDNGDSADGGE